MRRIEQTTQFRKDYKRELRGRYKAVLEDELIQLIDMLIADIKLPSRYFDHPLVGRYQSFRDCHIKPDLILIYEKPNAEILRLIRIGSHSELSL
jgi:mRNA interferase YafQ